MLQISGNRPLPGVLFGITHDLDGAPIVREPRILKVGIGLPRGRALNVWLHNDKRWYFRLGRKGPDGKLKIETVPTKGIATRKEAEQFYRENYAKADVVNYPRKLPFFTFTRPVLQDDGTEVFEPDFEAIEAHGPAPVEIDIVFLDDSPFNGAYQMWSTSELKCKGDGVTASRVLDMAANDQERELAAMSREEGSKYFPIVNGCWTNGCSYSKEVKQGNKLLPSPCKPGGDLKFQLAQNIRVGGTAYFHTSGYRSIAHIFSSIERIKTLTGGRLAGIPLKMILRPYKTRHNGQAATQYGVSLEFRAEDIQSLRKNLMEQAWRFRELAAAPPPRTLRPHLLDAPAEPAGMEEGDDELPISPQAISDEFYGAGEDNDFDDEPTVAQPQGAAAATNAKTATLADKLKARSKKEEPMPPATAEPAPEPVPAAAQEAAPATTEEDRDDPPQDPEDPRFHERREGDMF